MRDALVGAAIALLAVAGCSQSNKAAKRDSGGPLAAPKLVKGPGGKLVFPAAKPEEAPTASPRLESGISVDRLRTAIQSYFQGHVGRRIYVQVDKPLYRPGETIWIRSWDLRTRDLAPNERGNGIRYELVSPKGVVVLRKRVKQEQGRANNDFVLPEGVQGGEYKVRAVASNNAKGERPVIVSSYEPPRIKKELELLRKAYGPGDEVTATIKVKRPTGEPLANHPLTAVVQVDDQQLPRVTLTTNKSGGGLVRFKLPDKMQQGDGLLTVLVEDGGVTESVSKSIPIVLARVRLDLYPEGGALVTGVRSRVYFAAKNNIGKPADIEGKVVDDLGHKVASLESYHFGMGRFEMRPATGRRYHVEITRPKGIEEKFDLPQAEDQGCVMRSYDDYDSKLEAIRVGIFCAKEQEVRVVALMRETLIDAAAVKVPGARGAVVYLKSTDRAINRAQGVARVTVFDQGKRPLAERLVYRNRRNLLTVKVKPNRKKGYTPRQQVALTVSTFDGAGKPVPAELALAVVDDTVISYADDKTGQILSRTYLEPELKGKVEEPRRYFDLKQPKAARSLDLLMGTRGYRSFTWKKLFAPPPPVGLGMLGAIGRGGGMGGRIGVGGLAPRRKAGRPMRARARMERPQVAAAAPRPAPRAEEGKIEPRKEKKKEGLYAVKDLKDLPDPREERRRVENEAKNAGVLRLLRGEDRPDDVASGKKDKDWEGLADAHAGGWAVVRQFPAPTYGGEYRGPRTDFRETIHWVPRLATGKDGEATVTFYLSDAVTSFRVTTEGVGRGLAGRDETVIKSKLPFSMNAKLPVEVSAGDELKLPLTLTNETDEALEVNVEARFGELVSLDGQAARSVKLGAGKRESLRYDVKVTGTMGKSAVSFVARAGNLKDELHRELQVVPEGFPVKIARSGEVDERVSHEIDLGRALPGTASASVRFYPSPVASMISGLDGMLQMPTGCFEQASSSNYPNVMVLRYLQENDLVNVPIMQRSEKLLSAGYNKLVGYEAKTKGYEWFGKSPGHEALTAYGLVEFVDMEPVFPEVSKEMIQRTARWLMSQRDGKGGYRRNARALDSFGRASPEVTAAYITYSLTEAGQKGLDAELAALAQRARTSGDAYVLALAANALLNTPSQRAAGLAVAKRLAALQEEDGSFAKADHSITRSGGQNLVIETTALAVLALLKAEGYGDPVRRGVTWLHKNRGGYGRWGATQATILALKALTAYAKASRKMQSPGTVIVKVAGKEVARQDYEAGRSEPLVLEGIGPHLQPGQNQIEIIQQGKGALPYSLLVTFRSKQPASSARSVLDLTVSQSKQSVPMGETVRITTTVENRTKEGQPMTLARVGIPGGLSFQTWQLKELREKKLIDFYETRPREVIFYFRQLKPQEKRSIPIDLVADVPGDYTAPASSGYLYYTDEDKTWVNPIKIAVR